ncbi:MAG: anthranilate phosphoribosyltransferase [Candidatus Melainabacteria bacterium GWF2_37_15]|nr:MAG: anthranilate phosphoribosyltransferase [Candidatus Melainabacteria bacterium GWF2_37_15]
MLTSALNKIIRNQDLTRKEASNLIDYMSTGQADPAQIAAFLTAIKAKGETVEEITGFAMRMRELAVKINTSGIKTIADSCGTGGDGANTFNISTAAAIVAAACGVTVAKHSNASITSKCGSSNVIEALGIPLLRDPKQVENSLKQHSIAFIHAPYFHKSTFYVNEVRKKLGIRTIFNFLGPLTNPAKPTGQVIGVSDPTMLPKIAQVLHNLGCRRAMVVCGVEPILDEISICGPTRIYRLENEEIDDFEIKPADFGLKTVALEDIAGSTPDINAGIIKDIFSGKIKGPKLDILALNSAAVLWAGEKAANIEEGLHLATQAIENGKALDKLKLWSPQN